MTARVGGNNNDPPAIAAPTGLEFQITDTFQLLLYQKKMTKNIWNSLNENLKEL